MLERRAELYASKSDLRATFLKEVLEFVPQFGIAIVGTSGAVDVGALQSLIRKNEAIVEDILAKVRCLLISRPIDQSSIWPSIPQRFHNS